MSTSWGRNITKSSYASIEEAEADNIYNITTILDEVQARAPYIPDSRLMNHKSVGWGACFSVERAVYSRQGVEDHFEAIYVAVKCIIPYKNPDWVMVPYNSIRREIQVLSHASFRNAPTILKLFGYGTSRSRTGLLRPYLVVEYSEIGVLSNVLGIRYTPTQRASELFYLALDIATGLKTLHENHVIHGDVKMANILIFHYAGQTLGKSFRAKLADFGAAIVEHEAQDVKYTGTLIYNAPEQRISRLKVKSCSARRFYQADVWSFGLVLGELFRRGERYLKPEWRNQDETDCEFLDRIYTEEQDGLLERTRLTPRTYIFQKEREFDRICGPLVETQDMTLRDDPDSRANMDEIVDKLSKTPPYPDNELKSQEELRIISQLEINTAQPAPPPPPLKEEELARRMKTSSYISLIDRLMPYTQRTWKVKGLSVSANLRRVSSAEWNNTSNEERAKKAMVVASRPFPARKAPLQPTERDCFQLGPPNLLWSVQVHTVDFLIKQVQAVETDDEYHAQCAKLAFCYHVGFGVKPDRIEMFRLLGVSAQANLQAKQVFQRLWAAIGSEEIAAFVDTSHGLETELSYLEASQNVTYYSTRCRMSWLADRHVHLPDIENSLRATEAHQNENMPSSVSKDLYIACSSGDFDKAMALCSVCKKYELDEENPTPLHWLVMFDKKQLRDLGRKLVTGPCHDLINSSPTVGPGNLTFPQHGLELSGPPLHWAIRTRNLPMVCLLLDLGADIDRRSRVVEAFHRELNLDKPRAMSPLDIAVQLHLPEIVDVLLRRGAERVGSFPLETQHSGLSCFGYDHHAFTHYLIHGSQYREAASRTLGVLTQHGFDIQEVNTNGEDALMTTLSYPDTEAYVIEELLRAGLNADKKSLDDDSNAVTIAATSALCRKCTTKPLALIAPNMETINDVNKAGYNALHYYCIGGNSDAVEILVQQPNFDINVQTSGGASALHIAAWFEWPELIDTLVRHGMSLEAHDHSFFTPLRRATTERKLRSIDRLLDLGARVIFCDSKSILHLATATEPTDTSIVRELLDSHEILRSARIIDCKYVRTKATALHLATIYGDYEAVEALLFYGADRNTYACYGPKLSGKPVDFATSILKSIEAGTLDNDHPFPQKRSTEELDNFKASIETIQSRLEDVDVEPEEIIE